MPRATETSRTAITSQELTPPVGPFSQGIEAGGFIYFSGQVARHFSQPFPARTTIGVAALPLGACVEIDLVVKA